MAQENLRYWKIALVVCAFSFIRQGIADSSADTISSDVDATNTGQISLQIEHSLDEGYTFASRGNLLIHSLRSGAASIDILNGDTSFVSNEEKETLRNLCDKDGLYLLKLIGQDGLIHRTATAACNLVDSGMINTLNTMDCYKLS